MAQQSSAAIDYFYDAFSDDEECVGDESSEYEYSDLEDPPHTHRGRRQSWSHRMTMQKSTLLERVSWPARRLSSNSMQTSGHLTTW